MKGPLRQENQRNHFEQDICIHIFTVSSAMVGVCFTVIGLIRVVITLGNADTLTDDILAGRCLVVSNLVSAFLLGAAFPHVSANCIGWSISPMAYSFWQ
jgi:hypothetical protein